MNLANENQLSKYKYKFTVFTPTFNRAHTIERVYNSLKNQSFRDFEWLVVDDGSKDNTDTLIKKWKSEADFDIQYLYKNNGGKHTALNLGVQEAKGEFFLILDSDDSCVPTALERFEFLWEGIPVENRQEFSGITVLCVNGDGKLVGDKFPKDIIDISPLQMRSQFGVRGEKWGFHKTDVFREFPFPEISGERFIAEGLIWNRIALKYKVRHVNETLRIYKYSDDGLCASLLKTRINSPLGTRMYYREFIKLPVSFKLRVRNLINYVRFSLHGNIKLNTIIHESGYKSLCLILLPMGFTFYKRDKRKI